MTTINQRQYYTECQTIVESVVAEVAEADMDADDITEAVFERLFETVDGHQWIIYTCYHLQILQISSNDNELMISQGDDVAGYILKERGLSGLHAALAHAAMLQDCSEYVSDAVKEWLDNNSAE